MESVEQIQLTAKLVLERMEKERLLSQEARCQEMLDRIGVPEASLPARIAYLTEMCRDHIEGVRKGE